MGIMSDLLRLDATALMLIGHDVATLDDSDLAAPTPCDGWNVADLINHMNERHEALITGVLAPLRDHADNPRDAFAHTAARWTVAMDQVGENVNVPAHEPIPRDRVLAIHFVGMLVHRWDLTRALNRTCPVPPRMTDAALPLARSFTAPGSPYNGPEGDYRPALSEDSGRPAIDNLAAILGRDPRWQRE